MMAPLVGLVMIVKNEEKTLPRLAKSIVELIDHWTIVDTGSSDGTVDLCESLFGHLPGEVVQAKWHGFSESRNMALDLARRHSEWLLMMDADETLVGDLDLAVPGDCDIIGCPMSTQGYLSWTPRLLRSSASRLSFHGRTHEALIHGSGLPLAMYAASSFGPSITMTDGRSKTSSLATSPSSFRTSKTIPTTSERSFI